LTLLGLKHRDEMVLEFARDRGIPIVTTMSGGYASDISDTVEIHCNTIRAVRVAFGDRRHDARPAAASSLI
jgi:acetoin utilization deacetylase AcuC-like enzyme